MKSLWKHEAGDTIVEVLIAIVLVAAILGGAYATANRSLLATREAQERGEALNLAQGQLEVLRGLALLSTQLNPSPVFTNTSVFCLANGVITNDVQKSGSPEAIGDLPSVDQEVAAGISYSGACQQNWQSGGYQYDIAIDRCDGNDSSPAHADCSSYTYNPEPGNPALFIVHVRWDSSNGSRDEVTLQYRLYEVAT